MAPSVGTTRTSISRKRTRVAACTAAVAALTAGFLVSTAGSAQAIATAVPLGTAEAFAVLAGSGITNTGPTTIDGDVGTAPTPDITGKLTITLNPPSAYHQADAVAIQAKTDLITGYNNAAGQARDVDSGTELGGQTLVAGVYGTDASDTSLALTGPLTLDGKGRTDGVWVFQIGKTLVTASASSVVTHQRRASLQHLLAGRQLGNPGHQHRFRRHDHGQHLHHRHYRGDNRGTTPGQ